MITTYEIKWIIRDYWCLNWVHLVIKMPNLENIEFYTCTQWDHNPKFLIMAYKRNSWVPSDYILKGIDETKWTTCDFMRNDTLQFFSVQFLKYLAENFDNLRFQEARKVVIFYHQIVTSCIAMMNLVTLLLIWKEMAWKILNLENLEFYTCTQWDHNAKFLIMAYRKNSWVLNDCILIGIDETKWTTFDFMRNDVLQNYLVLWNTTFMIQLL